MKYRQNGKYDAEAFLLNPQDYRLNLTTEIRGSIIKRVLNIGIKRQRVKKEDAAHIKEYYSKIDKIPIEPKHYNTINASIQGILRQEQRNAREAGVVFNTHKVVNCCFTWEQERWILHIVIEGVYSRL